MRAPDSDVLLAGCTELGVQVNSPQHALLNAYLDLLEKWNKSYNLTSVRKRPEMITRHLLDSFTLLPYLQGRRIVDVGSGGGLPGVPLAILDGKREFYLLDSNLKKTRFLFQVKTQLGLDNIQVIADRAESYQPAQRYDCVVSRAFASLPDMLASCRHLVVPGGVLLAMKGVAPTEEAAAISSNDVQVELCPLQVPGLDEQRTLAIVHLSKPAN